jgi:RNA polymerase sigma-70 factor (ECF subfamily)
MQAWLFKIAHNMVVDHFRKTAKRKTVPIDNVQITAEFDLQRTAEANIELARVTKAMEQLTSVQRRVIELRFFSGLTSEEAGQVLKKRAGAVRELQSAAIRRLRKLLYEESQVERGAI